MKLLPILLVPIILAGCAGQPGTGQRVALDALATGGGGAAAYFAGGHDPALTTAGAVGGFVVSEGFQAIARSGRQKAYNSGIEEGKAIGQEQILRGIWEESNGLPKPGNAHRHQTLSPALNVPARIQNGVLYDAHSAPVKVVTPEKILTNQPMITNQTNRLHYETFQQPE
jgi:hypothetical protein